MRVMDVRGENLPNNVNATIGQHNPQNMKYKKKKNYIDNKYSDELGEIINTEEDMKSKKILKVDSNRDLKIDLNMTTEPLNKNEIDLNQSYENGDISQDYPPNGCFDLNSYIDDLNKPDKGTIEMKYGDLENPEKFGNEKETGLNKSPDISPE